MHGVRDALAYGVKVTGVTVFLVDEGVDTGPIVLQEAIEVRDDDDWESLEARILEVEHRLLPRAVRALARGRLVVDGRHVTDHGGGAMSEVRPVSRALLAVYDKSGCGGLRAGRWSSDGRSSSRPGGRPRALAEAGLPVTPVEQVTGSPEMLDGRVKTLHPAIHGGLLADRRKPEHVGPARGARDRAVRSLVVVNLYPFRETVASRRRHSTT